MMRDKNLVIKTYFLVMFVFVKEKLPDCKAFFVANGKMLVQCILFV